MTLTLPLTVYWLLATVYMLYIHYEQIYVNCFCKKFKKEKALKLLRFNASYALYAVSGPFPAFSKAITKTGISII